MTVISNGGNRPSIANKIQLRPITDGYFQRSTHLPFGGAREKGLIGRATSRPLEASNQNIPRFSIAQYDDWKDAPLKGISQLLNDQAGVYNALHDISQIVTQNALIKSGQFEYAKAMTGNIVPQNTRSKVEKEIASQKVFRDEALRSKNEFDRNNAIAFQQHHNYRRELAEREGKVPLAPGMKVPPAPSILELIHNTRSKLRDPIETRWYDDERRKLKVRPVVLPNRLLDDDDDVSDPHDEARQVNEAIAKTKLNKLSDAKPPDYTTRFSNDTERNAAINQINDRSAIYQLIPENERQGWNGKKLSQLKADLRASTWGREYHSASGIARIGRR
jgi:hypothetical protein